MATPDRVLEFWLDECQPSDWFKSDPKLDQAIRPHRKRGSHLSGRPVLIVDDVMTTGATLAATASAAIDAGAYPVHVLILARVAKAP